jgi:lipopolysaccharide transport system permease protein
MPFILQVLFFASQVFYPFQSIQQTWLKYLLAINPMNTAIEIFRLPLTGSSINVELLAIGLASTILIFLTGLFYFRKTEAYFADLA